MIPDTASSMAGEWLVSPRTTASLTSLDRRIEATLAVSDVSLRAMSTSLLRRGGKRIRPALLLLAGEFGTFRPERLLPAAAALELVHLASLYHDDVMDQAVARRHGPSINAEWGDRAAVIAGAFLVSRATTLLAGLDDACGRETAAAMARVCAGQLAETENAFNVELTEAEHIDIIDRKTATLFELPCRLGTLLADAPPHYTDALVRYGHDLGVAFQLADDALDVRGNAQTLGKRPLSDVREGVYTLSLLRVLHRCGPAAHHLRKLLDIFNLTDPEAAEIADVVIQSGKVDEVLTEARLLAVGAIRHLDNLPDSPATESLHRLAINAVDRAA